MTVYEGSIITCSVASPAAKFLVEEGGRIAHVGATLPERFSRAPRLVLGGRAMVPAFGDSHLHFSSWAFFLGSLDLRDASSLEEAAAMVLDFARAREDRILIGFGASPHSVAEGRLLSRAELDKLLPDRPLIIVTYDGHAAIANSAYVRLLDPAILSLPGARPEAGLFAGEAFFRALSVATSSVPSLELFSRMAKAADELAAKGIGLAHAVEGVGFPGDLDVKGVMMAAKGIGRGFGLRVFFQTRDPAKPRALKLPRIGGCFECAVDGCFGTRDAALLEPYRHPALGKGKVFFPPEAAAAFAKAANRAGLQIEMHAIGDAAFRIAVRALAEALDDFPLAQHRHQIIHACLASEEDLGLCADLGIGIAAQSAFLDWKEEPASYVESLVGAERAARLNPLGSMARMGIELSLGSDAPCTRPDPVAWIAAACNHPNPAENLSLDQALRAATLGVARASFDEDERGSLEEGKRADFVLLSEDPRAIAKEKLGGLKVEGLWLKGKEWKPGKGTTAVLAKSIFAPERRF